jgi:S1-C subfamily serine protease
MTHGRRLLALVPALAVFVAGGAARAADPQVLEAQSRRIAVSERAAVAVTAVFGAGGGGGGSGVVITPDGFALTNFHVVEGAGTFMKCGLNDGNLYDAVIVGVDPTGDVALIKLLGRDDFPAATLGDSDQVKVGDWVYAMGNPFLLANDFQPTVTYGIVSGTHRYQYPAGTFLEYTDCLQVDASINPGNSGGPLFNDRGEHVGINGRISVDKRGRVNSGAGFAISINQIKHFLGHLKGGRIVDHATLGATVTTESDGTIVVQQILEQSEAYRRGLREDDEVVSFAGRPIRSVNQFKNILGIFPSGWQLPLVYRREGQKHEIYVRLRTLHRKSEMMADGDEAPRRPPRGRREKPDEKKPDGENPDENRPAPERRPAPDANPPDEVPEKFRALFVRKDGFANYYFNKVVQDRLKSLMQSLGDYSAARGNWTIAGKTAAGVPFEIIVSDRFASLETGEKTFLQQADQEYHDEPTGTGGVLAALIHLRLLLTRGEAAFGEYSYIGAEPLDGRGELVDVLATSQGGAESRWYFPAEGNVAGFDTWLGEEVDPCEVRFLEYRDFQSLRFPSRMLVRHSGDEYVTLRVERADFGR